MKKLLMLFLVAGLVACAASTASAVVLIGGSTNNGNLDVTYAQEINPPAPGFFLAKPAVWQNVATRGGNPWEDEMSSEVWAGPAPTPVTNDGVDFNHPDGCGDNGPNQPNDCGVFWKPFGGNPNDGAVDGHLYQDHPANSGWTYTLTGWAGAEANAFMADAQFAVEFLDGGGGVIGGSVLSLLPTLTVDNGEPFDYKKYTVSAVAPNGTVSVRARASMIGAMGNPAGGGQAYVVDDFTLTGVPEPTSAVLVLLGLVGCGLVRRR